MELLQPPKPSQLDSLTALENAFAITELVTLLCSEQSTYVLAQEIDKHRQMGEELCAKYGVESLSDLPDEAAIKFGIASLPLLDTATRKMTAQLHKVDEVFIKHESADGSVGNIITDPVSILEFWQDLTEQMPTGVDVLFLDNLYRMYAAAAKNRYGANMPTQSARHILSAASLTLSDKVGRAVNPEDIYLLDPDKFPKEAKKKVAKALGTIQRAQTARIDFNHAKLGMMQGIDEFGANSFADDVLADVGGYLEKIRIEFDVEDPEVEPKIIILADYISTLISRDDISLDLNGALALVNFAEELRNRKADEQPNPVEEVEVVDDPSDNGIVEHLKELHANLIGGRIKQLAREFGLDPKEMVELRDGLHRATVEAPVAGLICAAMADQLDYALSVAERVRKKAEVGGRQHLEDCLAGFLNMLDDTSQRIKIENIVGSSQVRKIVEKIEAQITK